MALQNNFIPNTSLVFTPRDYAQQIAQNQADDTRAVQNAFKFGTQFADWNTNRKIADELRKENPDLKEIDALAASRINTPDTGATMWRWKKTLDAQEAQRNADLERIQAEKDAQADKAVQNLKYKIDAQLKPMTIGMDTTDADIKMWNNTLADLEEQGLSGNVGEDYMNKIWDMQRALNNPVLPTNTATQLANDMDTIASQFDVVKEQGGYGKDRTAYLKDLDAKYEELKELYENNGMEIPLEVRKQYINLRNKFNKKKTNPRPGAPKNPGR